MKINKLFFSRYFIVIVLIIGVIGTLPTPIAEGATTNASAISDKASSSTTEAANKALTATKQASQNSISNVVTQFASPMDSLSSTNSTTTMNSLISPLTINSSTIKGQPDYWGHYLESNVNYIFNSDDNSLDVGNTATITLKSTGTGIVPDVSYWILDGDENSKVNLGEEKPAKYGDRIYATSKQTALVTGSKNWVTLFKNVPQGGFVNVEAKINNYASVYIDIPTGGAMISDNNAAQVFDDTLINFHIKDDIFKRVIDDLNEGNVSYRDFTLNKMNLTWIVDFRTKNDQSTGDKDTQIIGTDSHDLTIDPSTHKASYDPSILKYDFVFYKDGLYSSYNIVYATLKVDFSYTKSTIFGDKTETGSKNINFGGFWYSPLNDPPATEEELPTLSISNQIQNLTNPDSNVIDGDKKGLEVRNVKNGDRIEYGANFDAESQSDQDALIAQGVYTIPIPKGMDIDTNSFKYTNYYDYQNSVDNSQYNSIDSSNINIQDDPNDSSKQLLTVNDLNISPKISGEIGRLVFDGEVTDDNQSDFTFTPSFKGVGGYDNNDQTKPLYVEADGQDQLINFDPTKPSGGVTLTPINIDFGSLNSIINSDLLKHRVNDSSSPVLSIQDDRSDANKNSQTVSVQQKGELTNGGSAFPGELRFYDPSGSNDEFKSLVSGEIVPIYVSKNGETIPSISWENNKGLLLHVNGSNTAIPSGKYTTTLDWTVSDTI